MSDDDLIVFYQLLNKKTKKQLLSLCVLHSIKMEALKEEIVRLRTNNKRGKNRGGDEDKAFFLFIEYLVTNKKRPTLKEWNQIVGSKEMEWKYLTLKVNDKEELLPNGLTKVRAKGWYYKFTKDIELFLKQKLDN